MNGGFLRHSLGWSTFFISCAAQSCNGDSNGVDRRSDVALGRRCLDVRHGGSSDRLQACTVGDCIFQNRGKTIDIATGKDKFSSDGRDKISRSADMVTRNHRASAAHRLVNDNGERLVFRRKNHEIGRSVDRWELRLIDKAKELHARRDSKRDGLGLELGTQWALAGKDQQRFRKLCLRKSAQKI